MTSHYIPKAQKQIVLRISLRGMKEKDIMHATGMGQCTYTTACVIAVELVFFFSEYLYCGVPYVRDSVYK